MWAAAAILGLIHVTSALPCPEAEAVEDELAALNDGRAPAEPLTASLEAAPNRRIRITLRDASGQVLATRRLVSAGSCDQLTHAVAVVLATWSKTLPLKARREESPPEPVDEPRPKLEPSPEPPLPSPEPPRPPPAARAEPVRDQPPPLAKDPPHDALTLDVGAAFLGAVNDFSFVPGGMAELILASRNYRWGGRIAFWGAARRDAVVFNDTVSWYRVALSLSFDYRLLVSRWRFDLFAGAAAALLQIGWDGGYGADAGLTGGVRAAVRLGPLTPFFEAGIVGWLTDHQTMFPLPQIHLDRFDFLFSIGIGYSK